jgi:uncharacterized protein
VKECGDLTRLTIYLGSTHHYHRHPVYVEIVRRAHQSHLAGAAVFRGLEGYGTSGKIHQSHPLRIADELPIMVVIVDAEERIRAFVMSWSFSPSRPPAFLSPFTSYGSMTTRQREPRWVVVAQRGRSIGRDGTPEETVSPPFLDWPQAGTPRRGGTGEG